MAPKEIALVHATAPRARAIRAAREGDAFRILATAEASGGDSAAQTAALALAQLDPDGRLPVHAITREVTAACLELPATADALPEPRLRELVRWEIEPFLPGEGEARCAWASRRSTANGKTQRLAFAVRRPVLEAWRAALGARELVALHPAWVGALAVLEGRGTGFLAEIEDDAIACLRVRDDVVESVRVRDRAPGDSPAPPLRDMLGPPPAVVWLGGHGAASVRDELERSGFEVRPLAEDAALHGALRHALGLEGGDRLACVPARDPAPPLHRRPWVLSGSAGLVVLGGVALWTASLAREVRACDARIEDLRRMAATRPSTPSAIVETKPAVTSEIDRLDKEQKALVAARARIEEDVLRHEAHALALLDALGAAADEDVSVDSCREVKPAEWHLAGFGLSDEAVQRFHRALGAALAPAGLETTLQGVRAERGRLGVAGFRFEVLVVRAKRGKP